MSNIAVRQSSIPALAMSDDELVYVLQTSIYPGARMESIKMAISYCRAQQLDPFQKPVHIVPMYDRNIKGMRDVIMPGVGLYRTQATRTGALAGVTEPEFGPDITEKLGGQEVTFPQWCRVTVRRQLESGLVAEFTAREFWKENYAVKGGQEKSIAPNAMWTKRPYGQIAKCAQAQALRIAFPESCGAYTAEEMEGKALDGYENVPAQAAEVVADVKTLPPTPDGYFTEKRLRSWANTILSGANTTLGLVDFLSAKYTLTPAQIEQIHAIPATYAEGVAA